MPEEWLEPGVYVEEMSPGHTIEGVPTSVAAFVGAAPTGPVHTPVALSSLEQFEEVFGALQEHDLLGHAVRDFLTNGGTSAVVVRLEPAPGGPPTVAELYSAALRALDDVPLNLLALPPRREDGSVDPTVVSTAATYCEQRRAVLLLDAPAAWPSAQDVVAAAEVGFENALGTTSANAALYFPWTRSADPSDGGRLFPAAGAVAGVIARTDAQHGVWKAPAGKDAALAGADGLAVTLDEGEAALLNSLGVNCLRAFPGGGPVVWGSRTLQGDDRLGSEWKYLPVRRTALFIEESLERGLEWVSFEANAEPLWARVRLEVSSFLQDLFRQGAFQGRTAQEAYLVRCDATTTAQADIDAGIVRVLVGFAPLRPAEFVLLRLALRTSEAE